MMTLTGHCYDSTSGQPPRGLQFILGTKNTPAVVDTIVMANLVRKTHRNANNSSNIWKPCASLSAMRSDIKVLQHNGI